MNDESDQIKNEPTYLVCPICNGTSRGNYGLQCKECSGLGVVTVQGESVFYWGYTPTLSTITLTRLKKTVDFVLNSITFLFGITGVFSLAWWFWLNKDYLSGLDFLNFWSFNNGYLLIFWISLIADMFIIYRISEDLRKSEKIKPMKYKEELVFHEIENWHSIEKFKHKYKVERFFYPDVYTYFEDSYILASKLGHAEVTIKHLFFNLLRNQTVLALFFRLDTDAKLIIERIKKHISSLPPVSAGKSPEVSNKLKETLIDAYFNARELGQKRVEAINLVYASMRKDKDIEEILYDLEIDREKLINTLKWFQINHKIIEDYQHYRKMAQYKPGSAMNRAYTAIATPILDHFGDDLTASSKTGRLDFCVGRDNETRKAFDIIESGHTGVIFVGNPGVGKNSIIYGIAHLMVEENVPVILKDKRLIELDMARVIGGGTAAEAQGRLVTAFDEAARSGNIILVIDNIEKTIGISAGAEESMDLSDVINNSLGKHEIICFATATSRNFSQYIEGKSLGNTMIKVEVDEPDKNRAILMISSKIGYIEGKYGVYFTYNAIEESIKLSQKFMHDKYLPAKAIEILELAAAEIGRIGKEKMIGRDIIARVVSEITHIPVSKATQDEGELLLHLEETIHEHMVDQEEAVKMVSASLRRARAQLVEGKRPLANFLFLGPTGVGKTELAKTLSKVYFGDEKYMIRLDMSEYQHPDSITKMIGGSDGTLGYLTEAVRKAPFSLILLDEFEKAYKDILNLFLQVMDDGRLTDGQGRTIDFTNSILIATSNVGAVLIQEKIKAGVPMEDLREELINNQLNQVLRPELINRFDGVIVFKPLEIKEVTEITKLMLNKIGDLLKEKGISLRYDELGAMKLAAQGFDPKFGARPLRRLLQDKIEDAIANKILSGELARRDTVIIDKNAAVTIEKGRKL
jgi:ATP-dependent Clp protease ATP-binding subunit ClpC